MKFAEQVAKKLAEFQALQKQGKTTEAWKVRAQYFQLKVQAATAAGMA
jgi:muconolactone delta-isomerase